MGGERALEKRNEGFRRGGLKALHQVDQTFSVGCPLARGGGGKHEAPPKARMKKIS